ncbi:MAG: hypothetical protein ACTSRZ_07120 [Promethearchaeota archaeon]
MDREKAAKLLKLRKGEYLTTVLPIGHPLRQPPAPKRKKLEDIVSYID